MNQVYRSYWAPRRRSNSHPANPGEEEDLNSDSSGETQNDANENDNSDHSLDQNEENHNNEWQYPSTEEVIRVINTLPPTDPSRVAWAALVEHKKGNKNAHPDWYPWRNELHMLLFLCRFDPDIGFTRTTITYVLKILKTLQKNGHIHEDYNIPKAAQTIENWWCYLPEPPIRMLFILALTYNIV